MTHGNLRSHESFKDVHSQGGLKIVIDPGYPTGYNGNLWSSKENGLSNPTITVKGYFDIIIKKPSQLREGFFLY